jgi:radical SAM superfamily enzyme YgiQ (UPF0313 family)
VRQLTLIYPAIGRKPGKPFVRSWQLQPLAIARLAALTPAHWRLRFMDDRVEPVDYAAGSDLVGLSIETYSAKRGYQIAARFRERGIPVVLGGCHATLCPDEAAEHADAVCIGEAESVWPAILADAESGRLKQFYHGDRSRPLRELQPDRRVFQGKNYLPVALVETSRGCPFQCNFCSIGAVYQGTLRRRPAGEIVAELREVREPYVFFVDDNIVGDPGGARELFQAIAPLGLRWMSQGSLHALKDESLIRDMARSGCMGLLIGFESLHPQNLAAMGKPINRVEEYRATLGRLRRAGVFTYGTFVFGYPHDTPDLFDRSVAFAKAEKLFLAAFNHLVPFPGTPLYQDLARAGRLKMSPWWLDDHYQFGQVPFEPEGMPAAEVERHCQRARKSFYTWGSIFRRGLEFRGNAPSARRAWAYWLLNGMLRRELSQKAGIPLGGGPQFARREPSLQPNHDGQPV